MQSDINNTHNSKYNSIQYTSRRLKNGTFRHAVKRVSLASKRKIWDTNDASIAVTQSALSHWEKTYSTLRTLVMQTSSSAKMLYSTAKSGANSIEHHLLVPVRDMLLLPAFSTAEQVASSTLGFIASDDAKHLVQNGMHLVRQTPLVGESILVPVILKSTDILKHAWDIAQYPIPSRKYVTDVTDHVMTSTKKALVITWTECYNYAQLLDANITRKLMHTQWRILGSGPYVTLDDINKQELINHLCERYMSHGDSVARYELAKHIQFQNPHLYIDLIVSGVLYERGGNFTKEDDWLLPLPKYRKMNSIMFMDRTDSTSDEFSDKNKKFVVTPIWFFMPNKNGEIPKKDCAWIKFDDIDQSCLEQRFKCWYNDHERDFLRFRSTLSKYDNASRCANLNQHQSTGTAIETQQINRCYDEFPSEEIQHDVDEEHDFETHFNEDITELPTPAFSRNKIIENHKCYPTMAKWYEPTDDDVLVDQCRHAVTFFPKCSFCGKILSPQTNKLEYISYHHHVPNEMQECKCNDEMPLHSNYPFVNILKRPTLWRFHGQGDNVRRGTWLLHTKRNGLQPYGEASAAILEDAYLFLKYRVETKVEKNYQESDVDEVLLTVQVLSPDDDEHQLVQFRSLRKITAVQKTLGAAISIFKRRVYRGVCWPKVDKIEENDTNNTTLREGFDKNKMINSKKTREMNENISCDSNFVRKKIIRCDVKNSNPSFSNNQLPIDCLLAAPFDLVMKNSNFQTNTQTNNGIDHLVLVVHGIGEMLRSIDFFGIAQLTTIVDCCAQLRQNHDRVLKAQDNSELNKNAKNENLLRKDVYGRVEFVPIEWHEAFAIQSQRSRKLHKSNSNSNGYDGSPSYESTKKYSYPMQTNVSDISLKTIPHLRSFANDTLLDVLYFMSPQYHDILIDIVTMEMNLIVDKFRHLTGYDGKVSIMAHSLGSVITWDILSHQKSSTFSSFDRVPIVPTSFVNESSHPEISTPPNSSHSNFQTNLPNLIYPQLSFPVSNTFILGSPVAVFLLIRNQIEPLPIDYVFPSCKRLFNIFHPYDPAAYRIEPLIDSRNASCDAKLISHWKGGFRVQYQTKMLWKKLMKETFKTKQQMLQAVEDGMTGMGLLDATVDELLEDDDVDNEYQISVLDQFSLLNNKMDDSIKLQRIQCGNINQGRRIDYMLQEREIENANEYVFALGAHSAYWDEKDLSLFVAKEIIRSKREDEEEISNS